MRTLKDKLEYIAFANTAIALFGDQLQCHWQRRKEFKSNVVEGGRQNWGGS